MRRGARTAQPLSRKCRFSSPTLATCTRSSSGSPRLEKRRARYSARPRWAATSSSRRSLSPDAANAANLRRNSSRWLESKLTERPLPPPPSYRWLLRPPLDETELGDAAVGGQVVFIDQRVENLAREVVELRRGA